MIVIFVSTVIFIIAQINMDIQTANNITKNYQAQNAKSQDKNRSKQSLYVILPMSFLLLHSDSAHSLLFFGSRLNSEVWQLLSKVWYSLFLSSYF